MTEEQVHDVTDLPQTKPTKKNVRTGIALIAAGVVGTILLVNKVRKAEEPETEETSVED